MVYKKVDLDKVRKQASGVELLVLDVDGVLTDGRLHFDAKGNAAMVDVTEKEEAVPLLLLVLPPSNASL